MSLCSCFQIPGRDPQEAYQRRFNVCKPPGLQQESLGPFRPEVSRECPRPRGCPRECPKGCRRPFGPPSSGVSKKCSETVPLGVQGTPKTFGHSGVGAQRASGTCLQPSDTPSNTPFSGAPSGTLPRDTSGPKGPRNPCTVAAKIIAPEKLFI